METFGMALVSGGFSIKICQLFSSFFYIAGLTQYTYIVGKNKQLFVHRLVFFTCFYKPKIDKFKEHKNEAESIPLTHRSLLWLSTGTPIKNDGVKIVLWAQGTLDIIFLYILIQ